MFHMNLSRCVCLMVSVLMGVSAHAEVYRWVDSAGRVHFGDRQVSSDPNASKKVHIRAPNLAKSFDGPQNAPIATGENQESTSPAAVPADPVARPVPARGVGVVASQEASCQAKKAAYAASKACFDACGRSNGYLGGRNNAGCEGCNDLPRPGC